MIRSTLNVLTLAIVCVTLSSLGGCAACKDCCAGPSGNGPDANTGSAKDNTVTLFDGKSLGKWKQVQYGGDGEVIVEEGNIVLTMGEPLTGVTWQGEVPAKTNYEISLEAQRAQGTDFFLGLTVPVKDKPITLVLGGWGGGVCGLSSLDSFDASENDTTQYIEFKNKQWYKVRMQVLDDAINVWLDDKQIVECDITGRNISIRPEVELSVPLGITSFQTIAKYRNITMKKIDPKTLKKKTD